MIQKLVPNKFLFFDFSNAIRGIDAPATARQDPHTFRNSSLIMQSDSNRKCARNPSTRVQFRPQQNVRFPRLQLASVSSWISCQIQGFENGAKFRIQRSESRRKQVEPSGGRLCWHLLFRRKMLPLPVWIIKSTHGDDWSGVKWIKGASAPRTGAT